MAEVKPLPPIDRLRALLDFDPDTGVLTWTEARGGQQRGQVAGGLEWSGYWRISVEGRKVLAHRVCYALGTGTDPYPYELDHINRDRGDNRLANLRPATHAQQQANRGRCPQRPVRVTYPDGRVEVCAGVRDAGRLLGCGHHAIGNALSRPTGALMVPGAGPGLWVESGITLPHHNTIVV